MTRCANPRCGTAVGRAGAACSRCLAALPVELVVGARSTVERIRRHSIYAALAWWTRTPAPAPAVWKPSGLVEVVGPVPVVEAAPQRVTMLTTPRFSRDEPIALRMVPRFGSTS